MLHHTAPHGCPLCPLDPARPSASAEPCVYLPLSTLCRRALPPSLLPSHSVLRAILCTSSFAFHSLSPHPRPASLIAYLDFYNDCLISLPVSIFPTYHFKINLPKSHILSDCSLSENLSSPPRRPYLMQYSRSSMPQSFQIQTGGLPATALWISHVSF